MGFDNFTRATCILYIDLVKTLVFFYFIFFFFLTFSTEHRNWKFKVSTKSMYKIQVARVKLSNPISKSKFINTNQMSIHLFPVMHLYALHSHVILYTRCGKYTNNRGS